MADKGPNTGYDSELSNFFSYMDPEHTPINIPDIHHNFLCPNEATVILTSSEFRSIQQQANSSQQSSLNVRTL